MKRALLTFFLIPFFYCFLPAQQIWYFGNGAGLHFSPGQANPIYGGNIFTLEGCATAYDDNGKLLFYSDGLTVWNSLHKEMQNGTGLNGSQSSTQAALIVPKPGVQGIYFLFTTDEKGGKKGLCYSVIDISSGEGVVVKKNISLLTPVSEKLTVVPQSSGKGFWVMVHQWSSNNIVAFPVSSQGVGAAVISAVGMPHAETGAGENREAIGCMTVSPDGKRVASAVCYRPQNNLELFDFNNTTGKLSNAVTVTLNGSPYGLSFSPDNSKLYISFLKGKSGVVQYDLNDKSLVEIASSKKDNSFGTLRLGPDGRLYIARSEDFLGVIEMPNIKGSACKYKSEEIDLVPVTSNFGLPNIFITLSDLAVSPALAINSSTPVSTSSPSSVSPPVTSSSPSVSNPKTPAPSSFTVNASSKPSPVANSPSFSTSPQAVSSVSPTAVRPAAPVSPTSTTTTPVLPPSSPTSSRPAALPVSSSAISNPSSTSNTSVPPNAVSSPANTQVATPTPSSNPSTTSSAPPGSPWSLSSPSAPVNSATTSAPSSSSGAASINFDCDKAVTRPFSQKNQMVVSTIDVCENTYMLTGKNFGASFNWSTLETTQKIVVKVSGMYRIAVTKAGCVVTDSVKIHFRRDEAVFTFLPSFNPETEFLNGEFYYEVDDVMGFELKVYDKRKNVLFETANTSKKWNGKNPKGVMVDAGEYFWSVKYTPNCPPDSKPIVQYGKVTVKREKR